MQSFKITVVKPSLLVGTRKGFIAYHFHNDYWQMENLSEGIPVSSLMPIPATIHGGPVSSMGTGV
jgi:hypothetical protein